MIKLSWTELAAGGEGLAPILALMPKYHLIRYNMSFMIARKGKVLQRHQNAPTSPGSRIYIFVFTKKGIASYVFKCCVSAAKSFFQYISNPFFHLFGGMPAEVPKHIWQECKMFQYSVCNEWSIITNLLVISLHVVTFHNVYKWFCNLSWISKQAPFIHIRKALAWESIN